MIATAIFWVYKICVCKIEDLDETELSQEAPHRGSKK